jgi:hypothetical protein
MTEQALGFTREDVDSLAEKLGRFAGTLTPGELAFFAAIVQRAAAGTDDTAGFGFEVDIYKWYRPPGGSGDSKDIAVDVTESLRALPSIWQPSPFPPPPPVS